jgi:hypothetical protein
MYFEADPNQDRYFRSPNGAYRHEFDLGRLVLVKDNGDGTGEFKTDPYYEGSPFPHGPLIRKYRWREMRPSRL